MVSMAACSCLERAPPALSKSGLQPPAGLILPLTSRRKGLPNEEEPACSSCLASLEALKEHEGPGGLMCIGWAARDASGHLSPFRFPRRAPEPTDVLIKILHCGVGHGDLDMVKDTYECSSFPAVPGHEIVGVVDEIGSEVTKFKVGDRAGVGYMVSSCRKCEFCQKGLEPFCQGVVWTQGSMDKDGAVTHGGYSQFIVVDQDFVLHLPEALPLDAMAPLLGGGITVYSPLVHYNMNTPGKTLGVIGLGGEGHLAVRFAKAFGLRVVVLSTSPSKEEGARCDLGADEFIVSTDLTKMRKAAKSLDFIIDTVPVKHELEPYFALLKPDGKFVIVGVPAESLSINVAILVYGRHMLAGGLVGGVKETQQMLEFCERHRIVCKIENISIAYVNTALARMRKGDVKYRFVIDVEKTLKGDNLRVQVR